MFMINIIFILRILQQHILRTLAKENKSNKFVLNLTIF